jgi:ABC-type uncharacterized transport system substrate-binding protein
MLCLAVCAFLALPGPAFAHPHAWVDLRSALVFDDDGRIVAIEEEWFFDTLYSALVAEELHVNEGEVEDVLDELAQINLASLKDYDYFTKVLAGDDVVAIDEVTEYEIAMRDDRLWLKFTVPLDEPVDPRETPLSYSVYDPSYYIEMFHIEDDPIMLTGGAADGCSALREQSQPTFEDVALAAALDKTQTGPADLGALFAEWVHVDCE